MEEDLTVEIKAEDAENISPQGPSITGHLPRPDQVPTREYYQREDDLEQQESQEDDEDEATGPPPPPGEPAIPPEHTTGSSRMLDWSAIKNLVGEQLKTDKIKVDPLRKEHKRGSIRVYGRGEGSSNITGYDKDQMIDLGAEGPADDNYSDSSASPAAENVWGQIGGLSPAANVEVIGRLTPEDTRRGGLDIGGQHLLLDEPTVDRLVTSYMVNMNVMHPILSEKGVRSLQKSFLKEMAWTNANAVPKPKLPAAGFVTHSQELPGAKRKRSPGSGEHDAPFAQRLKPGMPQRSLSTALILLVLALGKVCEHREKLPDVLPDHDASSAGSPSIRNGHASPVQPSPMSLQSSTSGLPSPRESERPLPHQRRASTEGGLPSRIQPSSRNMDVIPGLAYFAIATDIMGNLTGEYTLQAVHVNILASLYHGQLGRVLQSVAFLQIAASTLLFLLRR